MSAWKDLEAKVVGKYEERGPSECWPWTAAIKNNGYGVLGFRVEGRSITLHAHRAMYELHVGPLGDLHIDHACGNRACVNPAHLRARTQAEHNRRHQTKTHCKHGHPLTHGRSGTWCRTCSRDRMRERARAG